MEGTIQKKNFKRMNERQKESKDKSAVIKERRDLIVYVKAIAGERNMDGSRKQAKKTRKQTKKI